MATIAKNSVLWGYLADEIKGLILDGETLINHAFEHKDKISDCSYLVFPFSKAYEGFLKKLLLDMEFIREDEYYSDDIRIGRLLNPRYIQEHGNVFVKLCSHKGDGGKGGREVATMLWEAWRKGRNQVFHFFPHNFRKLSFDEALDTIAFICSAMERAVSSCRLT